MSNGRLIELLAKKKSGEITLSELKELNDMLLNDVSNARIDELVETVFEAPVNFEQDISVKDVERLITNVHRKKDRQALKKSAKVLNMVWVRVAAASVSVILLLSIGFYFFNKTAAEPSLNIVSTKKGSKSNITLPDGTKVFINADTRLTYDESFGKKIREVNLVGEAYFDVVKDKEHPFIVHTQTLDVKVLGTAFNVRAYENEANTTATLVRGLVEVALHKKNSEKITLKPNEKIIVQNKKPQAAVAINDTTKPPQIAILKVAVNPSDSTIAETQWTKNRLVFNHEKLEYILQELQRWYDVKIIFNKPSAANKTLSGVYDNDSLEDVLHSLKVSVGINYRIKNNIVEVF